MLSFTEKKGFTLIELIIVIAIIAIVTASVFVSLDPAGRIESAKVTRALHNAEQIDKAIRLYLADNPGGASPFVNAPTTGDGQLPFCPEGYSGIECVNIDLLTPTYLPTIPEIEEATDPFDSGYVYEYVGGVYAGASADTTLIASGGGASSSSSSSSESSAPPQFALDFNGVDATVNVPYSSGIPFDVDRTDAFSVSLWAKPTSTGATIFSYLFVRESGLGLTINQISGNKIIAAIADDVPNSIYRQSLSKYFVQGRYNHVVVTYNGSSINSGLNIYLDNTLITTPAAGSDLTGETQDNSSLAIGGYTGCSTDCFNGNIDDVRFFRKQLSAAEVTNLFNQTGEPSNLEHHWKFDEGSGVDAADSVGIAEGTLIPGETSFTWTADTPF